MYGGQRTDCRVGSYKVNNLSLLPGFENLLVPELKNPPIPELENVPITEPKVPSIPGLTQDLKFYQFLL